MKKVFKEFDSQIQKEIRDGFEKNKINASGNASRSLRSEILDTKYTLFGAGYIKFIDKGRGKGGIPRNFLGILMQWISDKGLSKGEKEDRSFAGAIAYNIKTKGSSKRRGSRPETDVIGESIDKTVPSLLESLGSEMARNYKSEVLSYLRNVNSTQ